MTQREKLIEILSEHHSGNYEEANKIADYLISNGVVVLPCKIGDIVYAAEQEPVIPLEVVDVAVLLDGAHGADFEITGNFGKTVFLTREEAEAALRKEKRP